MSKPTKTISVNIAELEELEDIEGRCVEVYLVHPTAGRVFVFCVEREDGWEAIEDDQGDLSPQVCAEIARHAERSAEEYGWQLDEAQAREDYREWVCSMA